MEQAGIPREGGPLGVMLTEHGFGREFVKGMSESAEKLKQGDRSAAAKFIENADGYVKLLSQHIDKEDNVLYPMADKLLSAKKQEELVVAFEKVEEERMGPGKHEELHGKLDQLVNVYLK
jgi:hemerythrin-like domain-containing protein